MQAKERGATVIHVDPRFSRTSAMADIHVPIRPGSDIAWLGGLINYVLQNDLYFKEYVLNYTNAAVLINTEFQDTDDLDGLFSGFDPEKRHYDVETWQYRGEPVPPSGRHPRAAGPPRRSASTSAISAMGRCQEDRTLQDPYCVLQILSGTTRATRRRWSSRPAACRRSCSCAWPRRWWRIRAGSAPRPGATRWAGPSTRPACR